VATVIDSLEPTIKGYHELKAGIKKFLDTAVFRDYTYVPYPVYDSMGFIHALPKRLFEEGLLDSSFAEKDSVQVARAVRKYQQKKKLKADGKAGNETIRSLNLTDKDKFFRIALSLDKYKMLPAKMPDQYLWVNLAGYYLQLWQNDSIALYSKVVCGKPITRTPELTSSISERSSKYYCKGIPAGIKKRSGLPGEKGIQPVESEERRSGSLFCGLVQIHKRNPLQNYPGQRR
jgi:hypothetical protein